MGNIKLFGIFDFPETTSIDTAIGDILGKNKTNGCLTDLTQKRQAEPRSSGRRGLYEAAVYILLLYADPKEEKELENNYLAKCGYSTKNSSDGSYSQNYHKHIWGDRSDSGKLSSTNDNLSGVLPGKTLADLKDLFPWENKPADAALRAFFESKDDTKNTDESITKRMKDIRDVIFDDTGNTPSQSTPINNQNGADKMNIEEEIKNLIMEGGIHQIIFTGAPGTGKTYIATKIAEELAEELGGSAKLSNDKFYQLVQFHPSYDYTDFVEGLRPIQSDGNNNIQFAKLDGIFKKFCREVVKKNKNADSQNEEQLYFFIIDEINRADLSKVFGELMYCLEKDKRGENHRVNTQYQNLPTYMYDPENKKWVEENDDVFKEGFYIPENVVIIGTMNDIDRSVESMDFALRRRFEWKEFMVDEDLLRNAFNAKGKDSQEPKYGKIIADENDKLIDDIINLNKEIRTKGKDYGLNRQYDISQGQFANLPDDIKDASNTSDALQKLKEHVWNYRIESLLREYMRGNDESEIASFVADCRKAFFPEQGTGKNESSGNSDSVNENSADQNSETKGQ